MKYYYKKNFLSPKKVDFVQIFFDNGDFITLNKSEIVDFNFEFYDKMIWHNNSITPVAKKGFVKLKIVKYKSSRNYSKYMNTNLEYNTNRKKYIENRCSGDSGIINIKFFDNYNWAKSVCGQFIGKIENEFLILSAIDIYPNASFKDACFFIQLNPINKLIINSIQLVFENCESFNVYSKEIIEMKLDFDEELSRDSEDYKRKLKSGFIELKLDSDITWRYVNLPSIEVKNYKKKHLENRLLNKKSKLLHNICQLDIDYTYAGFGIGRNECIEIVSNEEMENDELWFVGGYCEKTSNDTIIIHFGKFI